MALVYKNWVWGREDRSCKCSKEERETRRADVYLAESINTDEEQWTTVPEEKNTTIDKEEDLA